MQVTSNRNKIGLRTLVVLCSATLMPLSQSFSHASIGKFVAVSFDPKYCSLLSPVFQLYQQTILLFPASLLSFFPVFCTCGTLFHCLMSDSDTYKGEPVRASQTVPKTQEKESSDDEILEVTETSATSPTKERSPEPPAEQAPTSTAQLVAPKPKKKGMHIFSFLLIP